MQSHSHLDVAQNAAGGAAECVPATYPACALRALPTNALAATTTAAATDAEAPKSASALAAFTEKREAACEKWLDEFADSVNKRHYVTSALAYTTFAPNKKESLTQIFTLYSGAQQ